MQIVTAGIRKGISVFWGESILLLLFNFFCFLAVLPALLFYTVTRTSNSVAISIATTLLFLPLSFLLFALYAVLFDMGQGIGVRISRFFSYLRKTWKQALIFGVINVLYAMLVGWNLRFYAQFETAWAGMVQLLFLSISLLWIAIQLVMLPLYPRLEEPKYRTAVRNAVAITGRHLLPVAVVVIWTAIFLVLTYYLQALGALFTFVLIGALGEGMVGEIVDSEQEPPE